jgi:hypothetical protein
MYKGTLHSNAKKTQYTNNIANIHIVQYRGVAVNLLVNVQYLMTAEYETSSSKYLMHNIYNTPSYVGGNK